jgi:hypothetical protein
MPRPRFTPGERTHGTHWIGGWVGLRAGLDAGARRKILCPCRGSNLDHPIVQPVVRHCTHYCLKLMSKRRQCRTCNAHSLLFMLFAWRKTWVSPAVQAVLRHVDHDSSHLCFPRVIFEQYILLLRKIRLTCKSLACDILALMAKNICVSSYSKQAIVK